MAAGFPRRVALLLTTLVALGGVWADCVSYGVDYANGGSYQLDGSSNDDFVFTSMFQGCSEESITPVLMGPNGSQYACSAVETTPDGAQATSTCGIPYSQMRSGQWKIILQGRQLAVQRVLYLTVGAPETIVVTATPTVIVGITSTPAAITVISTRTVTQTRVLPPATITTACHTPTLTVTLTPTPPTVVRTSTLVRSTTDAVVTRIQYTTLTRTAYCHFPTKRPQAAAATVAATTVTYTQTTYTVTETSTTVVPPSTTTETQIRTAITTITPAPSTTCSGASPPQTVTLTRPYATVTVTTVVTSTVHLTGTVTIGSTAISTATDWAVASACWRAGGWMGWP